MNRDEPSDETIHFSHAGLDCKIVRRTGGYWCGYVRRPRVVEPVRWRSEYDADADEVIESDVDVWGGITYGPGEDGWVGFDDNHADRIVDNSPADTDKVAVKLETQHLAEQITDLKTQNTIE